VITFVVPEGSGGVRDYADMLATELNKTGLDARVFAWSKGNINSIDEVIEASDCIYLQYSGYGYAKRGAPLWMLSYLKKRRHLIKHFGVYFHELYATGKPSGSAFWLSPVQRHIAARLAKLADFYFTNRADSFTWLKKHNPRGGKQLPVFSNVGEQEVHFAESKSRLVVFGSPALRQQTYEVCPDKFWALCERYKIEIHDVGSEISNRDIQQKLQKLEVIEHGRLDKSAVSDLLASSGYGLLAYHPAALEKSGVFAAFAAHGTVPIIVPLGTPKFCELRPGEHYILATEFEIQISARARLSNTLARWYRNHDVASHCKALDRFLYQKSENVDAI
jgi:hypothetical protein